MNNRIYLVGNELELGFYLRGFKKLEDAINCLEKDLLEEKGIVLDEEAKKEIKNRADDFWEVAFPYPEYKENTTFYLETLNVE